MGRGPRGTTILAHFRANRRVQGSRCEIATSVYCTQAFRSLRLAGARCLLLRWQETTKGISDLRGLMRGRAPDLLRIPRKSRRRGPRLVLKESKATRLKPTHPVTAWGHLDPSGTASAPHRSARHPLGVCSHRCRPLPMMPPRGPLRPTRFPLPKPIAVRREGGRDRGRGAGRTPKPRRVKSSDPVSRRAHPYDASSPRRPPKRIALERRLLALTRCSLG